ncbi:MULTISPECIES: class I SAM-dependent methyltransferase [unclassified Streptomyces]|uniref:class I SAM-dependent methyltransferase n=1 Tax=unclassified Streptomyces TaxID=2593676 RepID=UPI000361DB00|nr:MULTISPECIES: class I SAM-dependent methyltransferase [unclassified Streptomyces]MYQ81567.1 methyltransferase domain-containing protein [Streptomyces sp. SID4923]
MTTTHSPDAVPGPSRALSFDRAAAQYAAARPSYPDALFDAVEDIAGRPLRGARALDVGAGTGIATRRLLDRGARVVAVEPGPGMAAQLRRDLPDAPLVQGDGNRLPFATASADLITYAQSWHWTDPARAGAEARRVLRPGGALALWWNVTDNTVPWLAAQEERLVRFFGVGAEHLGPRRAAAQDRDLPPDLDFTYRRVPWTRRVPLATHLDNLGSHSAFLTIDDEAARGFLAEERERLLAEFPDGTVEEAYVVELHAAVR